MKPIVKHKSVRLIDWGRISFRNAWDQQTELQQALIRAKKSPEAETLHPHSFVLCEHDPVYTLGKSGSMDHLLASAEQLESEGVDFFKINRGGDITYHGPGQIVGYPILDLEHFFTDVHKYVRTIEQAIINVLALYNIEAGREKGYTGVWLPATDVLPQRKICAIGIHLSRWVSMHGFALNVNTDLSYFAKIIPCGISDANKAVTSMQAELKSEVEMEVVKQQLADEFAQLFHWNWA